MSSNPIRPFLDIRGRYAIPSTLEGSGKGEQRREFYTQQAFCFSAPNIPDNGTWYSVYPTNLQSMFLYKKLCDKLTLLKEQYDHTDEETVEQVLGKALSRWLRVILLPSSFCDEILSSVYTASSLNIIEEAIHCNPMVEQRHYTPNVWQYPLSDMIRMSIVARSLEKEDIPFKI